MVQVVCFSLALLLHGVFLKSLFLENEEQLLGRETWITPITVSSDSPVKRFRTGQNQNKEKVTKQNTEELFPINKEEGNSSGLISLKDIVSEGNILPNYPAQAIERGWQGSVHLKLVLAGDGKVVESSIVKSSGFSCLDEVALKASRLWQFKNRSSGEILIAPIHFLLDS
ncbi:MAG: energy transducer TonB [Deltaproteobacteria bacterium]